MAIPYPDGHCPHCDTPAVWCISTLGTGDQPLGERFKAREVTLGRSGWWCEAFARQMAARANTFEREQERPIRPRELRQLYSQGAAMDPIQGENYA